MRRFLEQTGKSKEWLAVELGCSLASVTRMLGGSVPNSETLLALARLVGCSAEELTGGKSHRTA